MPVAEADAALAVYEEYRCVHHREASQGRALALDIQERTRGVQCVDAVLPCHHVNLP